MSDRFVELGDVSLTDDITSSLCEMDVSVSSTRRCLCDSTVSNLSQACAEVQPLDNLSGGLCHPNQCSGASEWPHVSIVLDKPFDEFSDNDLTRFIDELNESLPEDKQVSITEIVPYSDAVPEGSPLTQVDVSVADGNLVDTPALQDLMEDLLNGSVETTIPIVHVQIPDLNLPSSTPTPWRVAGPSIPVAVPVPVPVPAPFPIPTPVRISPVAVTVSASRSSRASHSPADSENHGVVLTPTWWMMGMIIIFYLFTV